MSSPSTLMVTSRAMLDVKHVLNTSAEVSAPTTSILAPNPATSKATFAIVPTPTILETAFVGGPQPLISTPPSFEDYVTFELADGMV